MEYRASATSYGVDLPFSQHVLEYEVALNLGLGYQVDPNKFAITTHAACVKCYPAWSVVILSLVSTYSTNSISANEKFPLMAESSRNFWWPS